MDLDLPMALGLLVTSILAAITGVLAVAALQQRGDSRRGTIFADRGGGTTFLFDGDALVDATPNARALLSLGSAGGAAWSRLRAHMQDRFPDFDRALDRLPDEGVLALTATDRSMVLSAEMRGGLTRITLMDMEEELSSGAADPLTLRAITEELAQLRSVLAQAPIMAWRETAQGQIVWANAAYLLRASQDLDPGQDMTWPLPRLFETGAAPHNGSNQRQKLQGNGGKENWFELVQHQHGQNQVNYALPADALIAAEDALRDFTQTLTKTFAHLPIGLAIFDRQRQLALFNPALLELTGLPPDFLSMRPTLFALLDGMRERNMIPEPKDYRTWRKQMVDLEKAASSGLYEETWSLPGGQTYRVIGRPHPNGAMALMIEDISTEISRIRRYRADLELGQAVIDEFDQGLAVFSSTGQLVMTNAAYADLWGNDPSTSVINATISGLCNHWRDHCAPTTFWAEAARFRTCEISRDQGLHSELRLVDGRLVECRFSALPGGSTLVRFRLLGRDGSGLQGDTRSPALKTA